MIGSESCTGSLFFQLFVQVPVVVSIQGRRMCNSVINFFGPLQVFIKGIEKIKVIKLPEVQLCEIAMDKMHIEQVKFIAAFVGMLNEFFALFYAIKQSIRFVHSRGKAKFANSASNVQDMNIIFRR